MVCEPAQHNLKQTVIGCLLQPAEPDQAQGLVLGQGGPLLLACLPHQIIQATKHLCLSPRVWKGLVLAAFFNLQSRLYYELLGNFMGKGDKETVALGLSVAGLPYHIIATPVGSVGFNQHAFGCLSQQHSCVWQHHAASHIMLRVYVRNDWPAGPSTS